MTVYESRDGRSRLLRADARRLASIGPGEVGVIVTSPPYLVKGRGLASAERYARRLAVDFGREWKRVLRPDGDCWLVLGDRHDGREWMGIDGLLTRWMRRTGWTLQAKGCWAQIGSRERWDHRINHVLRFRRMGAHPVRPRSTTLAWMLPLPRSHTDSRWDATPKAVIRRVLAVSARRGAVLDPFIGAGTVALVAERLGRPWIGVERDPHMAALVARRLRMRRVRRSARASSGRGPRRKTSSGSRRTASGSSRSRSRRR
jgi:DNA modification methylase